MTFARVFAGLFVIAAAAAGCALADALDGAPCKSDDDCLGEYECRRTPSQSAEDHGRCLRGEACLPGVQVGCPVNVDAECEFPLNVTCTDDESLCLCCPGSSGHRFLGVEAGTSAAICVACPGCGGSDEACLVGTRNCRAVEDMCGCVTPDDKIVDSICDEDSDCGEGFTCHRTLEQQAEPLDTEFPEIESGRCRPEDDPSCVEGVVGCRAGDECPSAIHPEPRCTTEGNCYCCEGGFPTEHVYAEAADGSSAACVACGGCPVGETVCTALEDVNCVLDSELCGCAP